jgi:hypothetical protein
MQALQREGVLIPAFSSVIKSSIEGGASKLLLPFRTVGETGDDEWGAWLRRSTAIMLTKESLEEDEWCWYTSNDPYFIGFSGLLSGMRFEV